MKILFSVILFFSNLEVEPITLLLFSFNRIMLLKVENILGFLISKAVFTDYFQDITI